MRAMILAAGLGTRLRPLTFARPKVLVPVMGMSILEFWIWQLHAEGFEAVIVNAFNRHELLAGEIREKSWPIPVEVRVEPILLGTGGGIRNALDFFNEEPFAVINGDIICRAPLRELSEAHKASGSLVSLLLHDWPAFNNVAVNGNGEILGFGAKGTRLYKEDTNIRPLAFTGIHFSEPSVLRRYPADEPWEILSAYDELIHLGRPPRALFAPNLYWEEMGSIEAYRKMNHALSKMPENLLGPLPTGRSFVAHPTAYLSPSASIEGFNVLGKNTRVMEGVYLGISIFWDDILVKPGSELRSCIVTDGLIVEGVHENEVLSERSSP